MYHKVSSVCHPFRRFCAKMVQTFIQKYNSVNNLKNIEAYVIYQNPFHIFGKKKEQTSIEPHNFSHLFISRTTHLSSSLLIQVEELS